MTHADFGHIANQGTLTLRQLASAPFRAVWRGLMTIAENDHRLIAVEKLHKMTDAELTAMGTNRADRVRQIFAASGAI